MAYEQDLADLVNGDIDMVNRDFRGANLAGIIAKDRDFTGAYLERANFTNAILVGSKLNRASTVQMILAGADLSAVQAASTVFHGVNLRGANLKNANFSRSRFRNVDFSGADLRAANFENAHIDEGCILNECLFDETTRFDGVTIFRPLASQEAFRFYAVDRGKLKRKAAENIPDRKESLEYQKFDQQSMQEAYSNTIDSSKKVTKEALVKEIDKLTKSLHILTDLKHQPRVAGIGHNMPPDDMPLDATDVQQISDALYVIKVQVLSSALDKERIIEASQTLSEKADAKVQEWLFAKMDKLADGFVDQAGRSLADWKMYLGFWMCFTGEVSSLVNSIAIYLEKLIG